MLLSLMCHENLVGKYEMFDRMILYKMWVGAGKIQERELVMLVQQCEYT